MRHGRYLSRDRRAADGAVGPAPDDGREQARRRHPRSRAGSRRPGTSATCRRRTVGHPLDGAAGAGDQLAARAVAGGDRAPARCGRGPSRPRGTHGRARGRAPGRRRTRGSASGGAPSAGSWPATRTRLSGSRDFWSTTQRGPSPANTVSASAPGAAPRDSASVVNGESGCSQKQNESLPGLPWAARSTPCGRPPPTLRTTSCTARPIVRLARLPWPSALPAPFIPIVPRAGAAADDHRADGHRRGQHAVDVELVVADRLDRGEHPRQVLGEAAGHHGGDGDLLDGDVDEVRRHRGDDVLRRRGSCPRASAARAPRSAGRRAGRRSSRGRRSPRTRPPARRARCAGRAAGRPRSARAARRRDRDRR